MKIQYLIIASSFDTPILVPTGTSVGTRDERLKKVAFSPPTPARHSLYERKNLNDYEASFKKLFLRTIKKCFYLFLLLIMNQNAQEISVHLFIHGTTLPGLIILNPKATIQEPINTQSRYVKLVEKSRIDERFYDDSIMLEPGLVEIPQYLIRQCKKQSLSKNLRKKAAIQAITIYDMFLSTPIVQQENVRPSASHDASHNTCNYYYLFGWSGLLNLECRKYEAEKLYKKLIQLKQQLSQQHINAKINFIVHAHSHGANITLHLAEEEEKHHDGLEIDQAFFYALPVQSETAHLCLSPIFKQITNIYSEGDLIQTADKLSTTKRKTWHRIQNLVPLTKNTQNIRDIRLKANDNPTIFRHRSFFFFNAYYHNLRRYKHFFFKNKAIAYLAPIPIVAIAPIYMKLVEQIKNSPHHSFDLNINAIDESFFLELSHDEFNVKSENLLPQLKLIKQHLAKNWQPHANSNDLKKLMWLSEHIVTRTLDW